MNEEKVLILLQKTCKVLQGNYRSKDQCKEDIESLLNDIDEFVEEITGKRIVKRVTVIEKIATGIYGK